MDNFEGSVLMDENDDVDETSENETVDKNINNQENESNQDSGEEGKKAETPVEGSGEEGKEVTDKGTKLDPNPQSAVHQQLANANREVAQYRKFMNDPKALKNYVRDLEEKTGQATGKTADEVHKEAKEEFITDPSKIETVGDLQSYAKYLGKTVEDTKNNFAKEQQQGKVDAREKQVADTVVSEINAVQNKYSALRPTNADGTKNSDFDPVLEKELAEMFDEADLDTKTGKYIGRVSIVKMADRLMKIRGLGETTGSKRAQTTIVDKRSGTVKTTGGGTNAPDESKMSASQLIASRMKRASGR